jgi:hypothetical protein
MAERGFERMAGRRFTMQAGTTFAPTIHEQHGRIVPAGHGQCVLHVRTAEPDVCQHVIVETGQKFHIAPMLPNLSQGRGKLSDQTKHHRPPLRLPAAISEPRPTPAVAPPTPRFHRAETVANVD